MIKQSKFIVVLTLTCLLSLLISTASAGEAKVRKLTAPAKQPALVLPNDTPVIHFDFGDFKASVSASGEMKVNGWLKHSRVRCADYSVGLRFGQGERGCTNVKWLGEPQYLSFVKHCNSARLEHKGYEKSSSVAADFKKITCAQRLIRCNGICD